MKAVIDIETGGFSSKAGIVEIGILVVSDDNNEIFSSFEAILQPYLQEDSEESCIYSEEAAEIHGITYQAQKDNGRNPREVVKEIESLIKVYNITEFVGHNIKKFDQPRLETFFERFSHEGEESVFFEVDELTDTLELSKEYYDFGSYSLVNMCEALGIYHRDKHRAIGDCQATLLLLRKLEEQ